MKYQKKVKKWGNSFAFTVPKDVVTKVKLKEKDKVSISIVWKLPKEEAEAIFGFESILKKWTGTLAFYVKGKSLLNFIRNNMDYIWDVDIKKANGKTVRCPHCNSKFSLEE